MAEPSLPDGWTALADPKGRTYYSCSITRETTWKVSTPFQSVCVVLLLVGSLRW